MKTNQNSDPMRRHQPIFNVDRGHKNRQTKNAFTDQYLVCLFCSISLLRLFLFCFAIWCCQYDVSVYLCVCLYIPMCILIIVSGMFVSLSSDLWLLIYRLDRLFENNIVYWPLNFQNCSIISTANRSITINKCAERNIFQFLLLFEFCF